MSKYRIGVVIGSIRRDSLNRRLAGALAKLAPADFELREVRIDDLPLYNQDDDANQAEPVRRMKAEIGDVQGVVFVTPEYNRSVPGVLKNAIDHGSRPYGANAWAGKPAGVIGATPGAMGTSMAQQHLRNVLVAVDMRAMAQPEAFVQVKDGFFDADGGIAQEGSRAFLQKWMDRYADWVRRF